MTEMPKWEVGVRYPTNVSSVSIGLRRIGVEGSFEHVASVDLFNLKEAEIHSAMEYAVSKALKKRDELNRKIDLANQELKCYGKEIAG